MNQVEKYEKLKDNLLNSFLEFEEFLHGIVENSSDIDEENRMVTYKAVKVAVLDAVLHSFDLELFEGYAESLTKELSEDE